jgi:hypothetical protein
VVTQEQHWALVERELNQLKPESMLARYGGGW